MYNAQETADRIKKILISNHVTGKQMANDLNIGINTLSNIRRGDIKSIETFHLIADYLDCSVDYLLGRTNNPNGSYVNGDNSVQNVGNNSSVTITDTQKQDTLTDEFIEMFGKLSFTEKVKVMNFVADMMKSEV
ncbi:MAG: helix-turn-helix transcriptional regulator [Clostridia bacterium]|nr:helix-turn-helix transcriptional regulator [Clostridia bacterium]